MIPSNLTEDQRRDLAALFLSKGWKLVKLEIEARRISATRELIYSERREQDDAFRQGIRALDWLLSMETNLFKPIEQDIVQQSQPEPSGDRYSDL